jgi:hypothetical protein
MSCLAWNDLPQRSLRENIAEHREAASRLFARGFILDHIPVPDKNAVLDKKNVRGKSSSRTGQNLKIIRAPLRRLHQ